MADPDPVILLNSTSGSFDKKTFNSFNFGYFLNAIFSKSFLEAMILSFLNNSKFGSLYFALENCLTFEKINFVEHPKLGLTMNCCKKVSY